MTRFFIVLLVWLISSVSSVAQIVDIDGAASANKFGHGEFAVPIELPPIEIGPVPELMVRYSSASGWGHLGYGWQLLGTDSIRRCARAGLSNNWQPSLDFSRSDRVCYGDQLLVANESDYWSDRSRYRTEVFSPIDIRFVPGKDGTPSGFRIFHKNGSVDEYGGASAFVASVDGVVLEWYKRRSVDRFGNSVTYAYVQQTEDSDFLKLHEVRYGGNETQSLPARWSISFIYEEAPERRTQVHRAARINRSVLSSLLIASDAAEAWSYQFAYHEAEAGLLQLNSIARCSKKDTCTRSMHFQYSSRPEPEGFLSEPENIDVPLAQGFSVNNSIRTAIDINLDGFTDFVAVKDGERSVRVLYGAANGQHEEKEFSIPDFDLDGLGLDWVTLRDFIHFYDLNRDGYLDIILIIGPDSGVLMSNAGGFEAFARLDLSGIPDFVHRRDQIELGDFDCDGAGELVATNPAGLWHAEFSDGHFSSFSRIRDDIKTPVGNRQKIVVTDFDNDRCADMLIFNANNTIAMFGAPVGLSALQPKFLTDEFTGYPLNQFPTQVWDVNGDGNGDIVKFGEDGVRVALGYGRGVGDTTLWTDAFATGAWVNNRDLRTFADINGDGYLDIVGVRNSGLSVGFSKAGSGFLPPTSDVDLGFDSSHSLQRFPFAIADLFGDGSSDFLSMEQGDIRVFVNNFPKPLLEEVTSPFGQKWFFDWRALSSGDVYSAHVAPPPGTIPLPQHGYVLRSLTEVATSGVLQQTTYEYSGGALDPLGGRFTGFAGVRALDQDGIVTETLFASDLEAGAIALPEVVNVFAPSGRMTSETQKKWQNTILDGVYRSEISEETRRTWSLSGAEMLQSEKRYERDAFGNLVAEAETVRWNGRIYESRIENTFENNPSTWLIGQLIESKRSRSLDGGAALVDRAAFTYDADTGALATQETQPSTDDFRRTRFRRLIGGRGLVAEIHSEWSEAASVGLPENSTTSVFLHNDAGVLVGKANALGHKHVYADHHPVWGDPQTVIDPDGTVSRFEVDVWGRETRASHSDGKEVLTTRAWCDSLGTCPDGAVIAEMVESMGASLQTTYFDSAERPIRLVRAGINGRALVQDFKYDRSGRMLATSIPSAGSAALWYNFAYDELNRVVKRIAPDGAEHGIIYDGFVTTYQDALGNIEIVTRDAFGNVVLTEGALGGRTKYIYDPRGNLVETVDAIGRTTKFAYDVYSQRVRTVVPHATQEVIEYNGMGLPAAVTRGDVVETISYDAIGRKIRAATTVGGVAGPLSTWTYDGAGEATGKVSFATRDAASIAFHYDTAGRMSSTEYHLDDARYSETFAYDRFGRISTIDFNGLVSVERTYDSVGNLLQVTDAADGTEYWTLHEADRFNRTTEVIFGNGLTKAREYDDATGWLRSEAFGAPRNPITHLAYEYDKNGNITLRNDHISGYSELLRYDQVNRVQEIRHSSGVSRQYEYDAIGNILWVGEASYWYGSNCKASSEGGGQGLLVAYQPLDLTKLDICYDSHGNTTEFASNILEYADSRHPERIVWEGKEWSLRFGPGRMMVELKNALNSTEKVISIENRVFLSGEGPSYSADIEVAEGVYVSAAPNGSRGVSYLDRDVNGSVLAATGSAGQLVSSRSYDVWGALISQFDTGVSQPTAFAALGYAGSLKVTEETFLMGHRLYHAGLKRFLNPDPVISEQFSAQGFARYSYVHNNPARYVDPTGFFRIDKFFEGLWKDIKDPLGAIEGFWNRNRRWIIPVVAVVAAAYTGGLAGGAVYAAFSTSAAAVGAGSLPAILAGAAAGAAAGATAAAVTTTLYGGDLGEVLTNAGLGALGGAAGGAVAGTFGSAMLGRSLGGGMNGLIHTGNLEGAGRGLLTGFIPENLWIEGYYSSSLANTAIGFAREGLRGYIIAGRSGAERQMLYHGALNVGAHGIGLIFTRGQAPKWEPGQGVWVYRKGNPWAEATAFGDVVLMQTGVKLNSGTWLSNHELNHRRVQGSLGFSYLPTHMASHFMFSGMFGGRCFMEYGFWMGRYGYEKSPRQMAC